MSSMSNVDARRVRCLNDQSSGDGPVVYVMAREQRVQDNWALLHAAEQAAEQGVALLVLFAVGPMFNEGSRRHNEWMIASLQEVEQNVRNRDIPFYVVCGEWELVIPEFCKTHRVGRVVFDFNPLQPVRDWRTAVAERLPIRAEEVDARNIIPCWVASPKAEFAA
ncbi:MAG TPA: deoxyribodipyrimidine photo-lyase, partial [Candidatus Paceibacterota bacterium]|nr:deoxyribodipyrimidine photo-lyase [Candidatus Paceibacterota bacterium]